MYYSLHFFGKAESTKQLYIFSIQTELELKKLCNMVYAFITEPNEPQNLERCFDVRRELKLFLL